MEGSGPEMLPGSSTSLSAWIPLEAPSMNSLLYVLWHQKRLETRPEVRMFRSMFKSYLPKWTLASTGPYSLSLAFHEPWYTRDGFPKRKDVPNLLKACVDAIAERYGFDDALVWSLRCEKVVDTERVGITMCLSAYTESA